MQMPAAISIACAAIVRASSVGVPRQRLRRRQRIRAARSNRDDPVVGLDQIAVAREQERHCGVHDDQHRLEPAQQPIGPPVLRELDGRSLEVAAILFELGLEARKQRERIGRRAGKAGQNPVVVELADLPGGLLHDRVAERDLAVAGHDRLAAMPHGQHRRRVEHLIESIKLTLWPQPARLWRLPFPLSLVLSPDVPSSDRSGRYM